MPYNPDDLMVQCEGCKDWKISELSLQSFSWDFMQNLKSLTIFVLRNNNISDTIPTNLGEFRNLTQLDLSFNNLIGQIPNTLFNLNSLSYLFLGNNKLNGSIPSKKNALLLNMDLSYNNLSGSLPSWVTEQNLQINLVGNNFQAKDIENSVIPSGLRCLQRNFPCNRGTGVCNVNKFYVKNSFLYIITNKIISYFNVLCLRMLYEIFRKINSIDYNFSINCGGPEILYSNGVVYESDNEKLGPATYFVTKTQRWAVSNVGYFTGSSGLSMYTSYVPNKFVGTLDSNMFQTARLSASSLRYYGLGLENGNYNVTLQFAESKILDSSSWKSTGRRIFDVYIQGNLVLKDFDIQKEAGKVSFKAVPMEFKAQVVENYLEIHLFWAGKGTCCIPDEYTYGPLISAISATPDFTPSVSNKLPTDNKKNTHVIIGVPIGIGVLSVILSIFVACFIIRGRQHHAKKNEELLCIEARPYTFSYSELKNATNDFDSTNKIGEGGFGPVYKGTLTDGRVVAIKQLSKCSRQGNSEFITEIATISAVQHRNLIKLHGCCIENDERLLVYEYLENGSLNQLLFGKISSLLNWPTRFGICKGIAQGLAYLHEESELRIIHRDVKTSNILLNHQFVPKISDFGLAKLFDQEKTHLSTKLAGTMGYLAPEYAWRGHLTEKADVFSFGIVALEIVSGKSNLNSIFDNEEKKMFLLEWAWNLYINNNEIEMVDSRLQEFDEIEVKRVVGISLLCIQASPFIRPSMSRIVAMLSGDVEVTRLTMMPEYLTYVNFDEGTNSMNTINGSYVSHHTSTNTSIKEAVNY
uniref:non-specific serine/threonine protein kinase n=1 Tax=Cajanus cajan TaxID=3821 RepID=A0A151RDE7_CAJCA|nr:putative LRR receptor-like serine/threonine-protein kinase At1g56130 family [Cajanus cajan]